MVENPLLSVIVPVYQVESYIDDCLKSLHEQSYDNIEIIIINDGSYDGSLYKCQQWQEKDSRIFITTIKNSGVSHARNVGLKMAQGELITFLDPDDWIDRNFYEVMIEQMNLFDVDVICGGFCRFIKNEKQYVLKKEKDNIVSGQDALSEMFKLEYKEKSYGWEIWDKIYKRDVIINVKFNEKIKIGEDQLFIWDILKKNINFMYIPLYGYHYRVNDKSATQKINIDSMFTWIMAIREIEQDMIVEHIGDELLAIRLYRIYVTATIRLIKMAILAKRYDVLRLLEIDMKRISSWNKYSIFDKKLTTNVRGGYLVAFIYISIKKFVYDMTDVVKKLCGLYK